MSTLVSIPAGININIIRVFHPDKVQSYGIQSTGFCQFFLTESQLEEGVEESQITDQ